MFPIWIDSFEKFLKQQKTLFDFEDNSSNGKALLSLAPVLGVARFIVEELSSITGEFLLQVTTKHII